MEEEHAVASAPAVEHDTGSLRSASPAPSAATSGSGQRRERDPEVVARRKLKKLSKQAARGKLTNLEPLQAMLAAGAGAAPAAPAAGSSHAGCVEGTAAAATAPSSAGAPGVPPALPSSLAFLTREGTAVPGFELSDKMRRADNIRIDDVRDLLLWLFTQGPSAPWVTVRNRALIRNVVLIVLRGARYDEWAVAKEKGAVPFLSGSKQGVAVRTRFSSDVWRADKKTVRLAETTLLFRPQNRDARRMGAGAPAPSSSATASALMAPAEDGGVEPSSHQLAGTKRSATEVKEEDEAAAATAAAAVDEKEEEEEAVLDPATLTHELYSTCMRADELAANGYPIPMSSYATKPAEAQIPAPVAPAPLFTASNPFGSLFGGSTSTTTTTSNTWLTSAITQSASALGVTPATLGAATAPPAPAAAPAAPASAPVATSSTVPTVACQSVATRFVEARSSFPAAITRTALLDWGVPFPSSAGSPPPVFDPAPARPRLLALDCEMCQTAQGAQLARVTLTDECDRIMYDAVIKPELPVIHHRTEYSGITPEMLAAATTTITEAQERIVDLLDGLAGRKGRLPPPPSSTDGAPQQPLLIRPVILVGHSLENDLAALRVCHSRIIDTSVVYPHPSGLPYRLALRNLTQKHLSRAIQRGHGGEGHDSTEDAIAAMHLAQLAVAGSCGRGSLPVWRPVPTPEEATAAAAAKAKEEEEAKRALTQAEEAAAAAALPPPNKRSRFNSIGEEQEVAAAPVPPAPAAPAPALPPAPLTPPVPVAAFTPIFRSEPRSHCLPAPTPELPDAFGLQEGAAGAKPEAAPARVTGAANRGLGATLAALMAPQPEPSNSASAPAPAPEPTFQSRPRGGPHHRRGTPPRSIFTLEGFGTKEVCSGITVIGSTPFLHANVAGAASGVSVPVSHRADDLQRACEKVAAEVTRFERTRGSGWTGASLTVAEAYIPGGYKTLPSGAQGPFAPDWPALDRRMQALHAKLPAGTVVLTVMQGLPPPESAAAGVIPSDLLFGVTLAHVTQAAKEDGSAANTSA